MLKISKSRQKPSNGVSLKSMQQGFEHPTFCMRCELSTNFNAMEAWIDLLRTLQEYKGGYIRTFVISGSGVFRRKNAIENHKASP